MRFYSLSVLFVLLCSYNACCFAQAGITASPSKLYYHVAPGASGIQSVTISNPLSRDLEVGVSLGDWKYDLLGTNSLHDPGTLETSCTDWIKVLPGSYFTLLPNERKELSIELTVPSTADKTIPVHTAMLYFTQLNPNESKSTSGAAIKVSVRMGVKIYHSFSETDKRDIEITDFRDKQDAKNLTSPGFLELAMENTGQLWLDGKIKWELFNAQNGEKVKMDDLDFLMLPGDKRTLTKELPKNLSKGRYSATAIVNYGNRDELKMVELEFEY